jgi:hypothetical protein
MSTVNKSTGIALAIAAAGLFSLAGCASEPDSTASAATVHCAGVNACKGQGACKTASNSCKGQNACKGQGFVAESAAECKAAGGSAS